MSPLPSCYPWIIHMRIIGEISAASTTSLLLGSGHPHPLCPGNCSMGILNPGKVKVKIHRLWIFSACELEASLHSIFSACFSSALIQLVVFKACLADHIYFKGWGRSVGKEQPRVWSWAAPRGGRDKTLGSVPCVCLCSMTPSFPPQSQNPERWEMKSAAYELY